MKSKIRSCEVATALPASQPASRFQISLTLSITDERALWTAAAARLLAVPGMTLEDVVDMIGPSEDPVPRDCLAALTNPDVLPGCVLDDYWIDSLPTRGTRAARDRRPAIAERPVRPISARPDIGPVLRLGPGDILPSQRQVN